MKIQIKILYGSDYERYKATMTLYELSNMVSQTVSGFFDSEDRLHLQYHDDKGTYVTITKQSTSAMLLN